MVRAMGTTRPEKLTVLSSVLKAVLVEAQQGVASGQEVGGSLLALEDEGGPTIAMALPTGPAAHQSPCPVDPVPIRAFPVLHQSTPDHREVRLCSGGRLARVLACRTGLGAVHHPNRSQLTRRQDADLPGPS